MNSKDKTPLFYRPAFWLLLIGSIVGILFCTFLPYGAGLDEDQHLIRIFDLSGGHLIPNRPAEAGNYTFSEFETLSYLVGPIQTSAAEEFKPENFSKTPDWQNMIDGHTTATYPPVVFLSQALIAGIAWRLLDLPIFPVIIAMRLAGFAFYLLLCYLTLKLLPYGKWVFVVLALSLMTLFQAATLNADGYTIAVSFLFIGLIFNIYNKDSLDLKDGLKLAGCAILIGLAKPGTILLLLGFLVLIKRPVCAKTRWLVLSGAILAVVISVGWSALAVLNTTVKSTQNSRMEEILLVLNNLPDFIPIYFKSFIRSIPNNIYLNWVGIYGYWPKQVPGIIYILFPLALICAFFTDKKRSPMPLKARVWISLIALFIMVVLGSVTIIFKYLPGKTALVAQGRYMVPFAPLLFLAWAGIAPVKGKITRIATGLTLALLVALTSIYTVGAYRTFYTPCMNNYSPCLLPIYRDIQLESPGLVGLDAETVVSQSFTPECSRIKSIEVHIPQSINSSGEISMELLDGSGSPLRSVSLPLEALQEQTTLALAFQELPVEAGKTYRFELRLLDQASPDEKLELIASDGNEYGAGQLLVNGVPSPTLTDLYFQYECER